MHEVRSIVKYFALGWWQTMAEEEPQTIPVQLLVR
jgi:hypothetical protein